MLTDALLCSNLPLMFCFDWQSFAFYIACTFIGLKCLEGSTLLILLFALLSMTPHEPLLLQQCLLSFEKPTHIMEVVAKAKWLILYFSFLFFFETSILSDWFSLPWFYTNGLAPGYGMEARQRCVVTNSLWIWVRHVVQLAHRCFSWGITTVEWMKCSK